MSNLYQTYTPPASGGGNYLKLEDGQTVKLRFVGYPVVFTKQFPGSESPTTRYAWAVYIYDEDRAAAFEQGITFFRKLANLAKDEEWGDPSTYDIKVRREGSGTETEYHLNPSPAKSKLTTEQLEKVAKINLSNMYQGSVSLEDASKGKKPTTEEDIEVSDEQLDKPLDLSDIPF